MPHNRLVLDPASGAVEDIPRLGAVSRTWPPDRVGGATKAKAVPHEFRGKKTADKTKKKR
jgi:hypothetical protein